MNASFDNHYLNGYLSSHKRSLNQIQVQGRGSDLCGPGPLDPAQPSTQTILGILGSLIIFNNTAGLLFFPPGAK